MTLESQMSELITKTNDLLKSYVSNIGDIATLKEQLARSQKEILALKNAIQKTLLFQEMYYPSNPLEVLGLNLQDPEALQYQFKTEADYSPKLNNKDCFGQLFIDSDERFMRDITVPEGTEIELHVLANVGDGAAKLSTVVSFLRMGDGYFEGSPSNPNAFRDKEGNVAWKIEGYGKNIFRNVIKIKSFPNDAKYGTLRVLNLGTRKVRIHAVGIAIKKGE